MPSLRLAVQANQARVLPGLLLVAYLQHVRSVKSISVSFEDAAALNDGNGAGVAFDTGKGTVAADADVLPCLMDVYAEWGEGGAVSHNISREHFHRPDAVMTNESQDKERVDEWVMGLCAAIAKADLIKPDMTTIESALRELDAHLTLRSYVVGHSVSAADIIIWGALRGNKVAYSMIKRSKNNISRWFNFVESRNPWIVTALADLNAITHQKRSLAIAEGGNYDIGLGPVEGGVVTRFPPEPSGLLHIGHAKAALLNEFFAHEKGDGTLICRFDDTNPSKESQEFEDSITADLEMMEIHFDRISHSSDFFPQMYEYCVHLLHEGRAYADNTEWGVMKEERKQGIESKCRGASAVESLARFEEMRAGSDEGIRWCVRAKISIDNVNKALRDPVIYRCNLQPHHRTGSTWKVYPTYDFCAPMLDSIEGVTHALRTNEYRDRNPQYEWVQKALGLREVEIFDFARMNFIRTVLSKRKLTEIVASGAVWGWDDPRMPTLQGMRRRGMSMGALREFIMKQGPSQNIINQDWTQLWAINKNYIDSLASRHTAVTKDGMVEAFIRGGPETPYTENKPKHNKNPELGSKTVVYGKRILIDQDDAQSFAEDEEITLMNWGNAIVRKIHGTMAPSKKKAVTSLELDLYLQGDFKKTKKKITWLAREQDLVPVHLIDFDHLITKDRLKKLDNVEDYLTPQTEFGTEVLADCNVASLVMGDIIQFERKGYFRVDRPWMDDKPVVMFEIPTGKRK